MVDFLVQRSLHPLFGPPRLFGRAGDHQHELTQRFGTKTFDRRRNRSAPELFVDFGQLAGRAQSSVAENRQHILQRLNHAVRRFVEDQCAPLGLHFLQRAPPLTRLAREKANEDK